MKLRDFFAKYPVFTHEGLVEFLSNHGSTNVKTRESILSHYIKTGRLLRVRRGLYLAVPQGLTPEKCPIDPYLLASKLAPDSVLAYHTSLELQGKAYSVYREFVYLTRSRSRLFSFQGQNYRGVAFPKRLRDKGQESFGVISVERLGLDLQVTSLERSLVDILDRPALGGTWEEIWRSLELVEFFDLDKVVEYAMLLGNSTTVAKVGFFLEQFKDTLMPNEDHLERLRSLIPVQPHYMDPHGRKDGRLIKGWNLVVPLEILERRWEQVL